MSVGILTHGAYVPPTRLPLSLIAGRPARDGDPEKAVAANDEDAITMAVAAGIDCLHGVDRTTVDGLYLATTSSPYREKLGAALVAKALDLGRSTATVDYGGSPRAGTTALAAAVDAVSAGSAQKVLVIASDARLAPPRSGLERGFGDAAVAFLVGASNPVLRLEVTHSVTDELTDVWRAEDDDYVRSWEDRFVVGHGYQRNVVEVARALLDGTGDDASAFRRLALYGPDARGHASAAREMGFRPEQLVEPPFGRLGNTGTSFAPLLLAMALERTGDDALREGDQVLLVSYGSGAEALSFTTCRAPASPRPGQLGVLGHLARRRPLRSYQSYLAARHLDPREHDPKGGPGVPATVAYRDRDADLSLLAHRCNDCGTMHFPKSRVCYRCHARDDFDLVRLSDRKGTLASYTFDWFFPTPEPPTIAGMIDIDGCRLYVQVTDAEPDAMRCDLPVEMVFRKIHDAGGRPNYFWKARPVATVSGAEGGT